MQFMYNYIQLIRLPNLVFLAVIQLIMSQVVILPILQTFGFESSGNYTNLILLITATVLTAAGGYVLNDYFDVKIDAINKPSKQIVGKAVSRRSTMIFYQALTITGVVSGLFLSYLTRNFTLAFIFVVTPGLLWFYSSNYKRQFLIGNLVVAFVSALSILIVGMMELAVLEKMYGSRLFETNIPRSVYAWISGFAIFAFLCTWIREIIKDMEDEQGDREMECRTMPIKWGSSRTKLFLYLLIAVTVVGLLYANSIISFNGSLTIRYTLFGIVLPLCALAYLIFKAKIPRDYHQASTLAKVIMVVGVLYGFIFYFLMAQTFGIKMFGLFVVQ